MSALRQRQPRTIEGEPVPILAQGHLLDRDDVLAAVELGLCIDALRCRHNAGQRLDLETGAHALVVDVDGEARAITRFADVERELDGAVDAKGERAGCQRWLGGDETHASASFDRESVPA